MILDAFAGPGGWDEGLKLLGRTDVVGIEWDADACRTAVAAGHARIRADVETFPLEHLAGKVEGLIMSPPCPDFSTAGKGAGIEGTSGRLIFEVPRWVRALRPRWLACEQVPPALEWWERFAADLGELGYATWTGVLNAANYGVPQTRRRAFLLASLDRQPGPPAPTHERDPRPNLFGRGLLPWVSMADALGWGHGQVGFPRLDDLGTSPDGYRERDWRNTDEPAFNLTEKARSWVVRSGQTVGSRADQWTVNTGRDWKPGGTRDDAQTIPMTAPAPAIDGKGRWFATRSATTVQGDPRMAPRSRPLRARDRIGGSLTMKVVIWQRPANAPKPGHAPISWETEDLARYSHNGSADLALGLRAMCTPSFLIQEFDDHGTLRLSVNRVEFALVDGKPMWKPGISWDELMHCKQVMGYGDRWAVEIFPPDDRVVNVANMRHLWLLEESPPFGWSRS